MNVFDVSGKTIAVTGGAGHLGSVICAGLAGVGANVICLSSKPYPGNDDHIISYAVDCADEEQLDDVLGPYRLDGLVNCAARSPRHADMAMLPQDYVEGLAFSAGTYFVTSRSAARLMSDGGSIVNLASMWGMIAPTEEIYLGMKNDPSFCGSSGAGAILALTRHMAVHLAPRIRVNALVPGWFPKKRGPDNRDYMGAITSRVPMRRIGKPEELVGAVIFLLSQASSYMTGQQLVVDGGYSVR